MQLLNVKLCKSQMYIVKFAANLVALIVLKTYLSL